VKRRRVVFAPEARIDLLNIYDWIAEAANPAVAVGYIERLEDWCMSFDIAGERGRAREDIRPGLRVVGFERRLTVAFTVSENEITILRLFQGGRDWENESL